MDKLMKKFKRGDSFKRCIDAFNTEVDKNIEFLIEEVEDVFFQKSSYSIDSNGTIEVQLHTSDPWEIHLSELLPSDPKKAKAMWKEIKKVMDENFEEDVGE